MSSLPQNITAATPVYWAHECSLQSVAIQVQTLYEILSIQDQLGEAYAFESQKVAFISVDSLLGRLLSNGTVVIAIIIET